MGARVDTLKIPSILNFDFTLFVTGISLIIVTESESLSIKVLNDQSSQFISKADNAAPPMHFPEVAEPSPNKPFVQGTPILHLGNFINNTNKTIINNIKKEFDDIASIAKDKLPRIMTVILNDNDTQHDTQNTTNINLKISTNESINNNEANKLQVKSVKSYNNELSKRTTIIFLVSVTLVSTFFYIFLVSLRKILE